jgi:NhaA family Na+:H+ antiporter
MAKKWDLFKDFFHSEKASGFVLIGCTLISLIIANSGLGENYVHLWHKHFNIPWLDLDLSYSHWVNDGLMAIFFYW